ncbi:hypothetical protein E2C01_068776 [Portunus trituberculatus]|uniref:Uncharacterized protein n=1 Tax=Portunus trituberculatus TaxID=210409 RepID=A0A5B7I0G0_PORTR|nr:hypothetical protein [Portunus trituberculatus]
MDACQVRCQSSSQQCTWLELLCCNLTHSALNLLRMAQCLSVNHFVAAFHVGENLDRRVSGALDLPGSRGRQGAVFPRDAHLTAPACREGHRKLVGGHTSFPASPPRPGPLRTTSGKIAPVINKTTIRTGLFASAAAAGAHTVSVNFRECDVWPSPGRNLSSDGNHLTSLQNHVTHCSDLRLNMVR